MVKKGIAIIVLSSFIFLAYGCETTKGVAKGIGEGIGKDASNTCSFVKRVDAWMKKNLW